MLGKNLVLRFNLNGQPGLVMGDEPRQVVSFDYHVPSRQITLVFENGDREPQENEAVEMSIHRSLISNPKILVGHIDGVEHLSEDFQPFDMDREYYVPISLTE